MKQSTALTRYLVAILAVLAGFALRLALARYLRTEVPYVTFFPAVMFSAWFGGLGPGVFSSFLTLIGFAILRGIVPFRNPSPANTIGAIVFLGVSIFTSMLTEELRRSRSRMQSDLEEIQAALASREKAERDLAENRDLLRTTLASIGDSVITADAAGKVTFLNPPAETLTGWSSAEALGKFISDVFVILNEQTRLRVSNPTERALREGTIVGLGNHTILLNKNGRQIPIDDSAAPIRDKNDRIFGTVLVFRDVTQRRASEMALRKSEETLKLAVLAGQIGVWDWDLQGQKVRWSDRMFEIHGLKVGTFDGGSDEFLRLVHPEDRSAVRESMGGSMQGIPPTDFQFRVIRPSGEVRWVATTALLSRNDDGEITRILGATTDITKAKHAEEELKLINRTLLSANRSLEEFAYVASHDLQEPLRMVNIYTELLLRRLGNQDAEVNQYAAVLSESVTRMQALLRDLLEYSRASDEGEMRNGRADLILALDEAKKVLQNEIQESDAIINASALPITKGETLQLCHVFQNLLSNAIKYRKADVSPQIEIRGQREGAEWIISVKDNGIGFQPQYERQIFGLFKRLHTREYPGTGLGLAICQRIVERYEGRIWAESMPEEGSTFFFTLPALPESDTEPASAVEQ